MKKIFSLFVCLLFAGGGALWAQSLQVTGIVTDASDQEPLTGVYVVVKGTNRSTSTDLNGRYTIAASANDVLVFTFIGMKSVEIAVSGRSVINVILEGDTAVLEEVTVIGYGVSRPGSQVAAISTVRGEQLTMAVTSVDKALQGNAAGVLSLSGSGQPGAGQEVTIRGINSVSGGTTPLYVLDGVPMTTGNFARTSGASTANNNMLSTLNPNDIESMVVLKDAAATSIYGSRAANGVVLITTKQGRAGKTQFNLRMSTGFSARTSRNFRMMNKEEFIEFQTEALLNANYPNVTVNVAGRPILKTIADTYRVRNADYDFYDFDWVKAAFRDDAPTRDVNFTMSGGNDNSRYLFSLGYHDNAGMVIRTGFKRYSSRLNFNHRVNSKLSFGINTSLTYQMQENNRTTGTNFNSPIFGAMIYSAIDAGIIDPGSFLYNPADGSYSPAPTGPNVDYVVGYSNANFLANAEWDDYMQRTSRLGLNANATYAFTDNLVLKFVVGGDYSYLNEYDWKDPRPRGNSASYGFGLIDQSVREIHTWTETLTLNYMKDFGDHSFNLLLAQEASEEGYGTIGGQGQSLPPGGLTFMSSAAIPRDVIGDKLNSAVASFFSNINYNFRNTYYLQATIRTDGSSRLASGHRWSQFWSVGGSWRVTNEPFLKGGLFNSLILRASYGTQGNSSGISRYASRGLYAVDKYDNIPAIYPNSAPNPELTWETVTTGNVGIDFSMLRGRLGGTIDWYHKNTTDMLLNRQLSRTSGFNTIISNMGTMYNTGIEVSLNTNPVRLKNFVWNVNMNVSHNRNRITKLNEGDIFTGAFVYREGHDIQSFWQYAWAGVNPADGRPMYYDLDGEIMYSISQKGDTRRIAGTASPYFFGGLTNRFAAFGFDLSLMFFFTYGNKVYEQYWLSATGMGYRSWYNVHESAHTRRWRKEGDIATFPKAVFGYPTSTFGNNNMDYNVLDGSYIRLRDLNFGYSLPQKWVNAVGLNNLRLYTQATNLFTITRFPSLDPEVGGGRSGGSNTLSYPNARTITFGIDLKF
ncbi:MAG: TonB-dependent receptor [Bacteroidales bacterium]|nr:TonB-dependent receptor [Bacteroidales bacterium]